MISFTIKKKKHTKQGLCHMICLFGKCMYLYLYIFINMKSDQARRGYKTILCLKIKLN